LSIQFIVSENFIRGVADTGEKVKNLSPVSTTSAITFSSGVIDTSQKKKNLKFIASVTDTANKLFTSVNNTCQCQFAKT
jgi:hypothetical protein